MCLTTVMAKAPPREGKRYWKVVEKTPTGRFVGRVLRFKWESIGRWNKARKKDKRCISASGTVYPAGFHMYKSVKGTVGWKPYNRCFNENLIVVVEVEYKGGVVQGTEWDVGEKFQTVVAKECRIVRELTKAEWQSLIKPPRVRRPQDPWY